MQKNERCIGVDTAFQGATTLRLDGEEHEKGDSMHSSIQSISTESRVVGGLDMLQIYILQTRMAGCFKST